MSGYSSISSSPRALAATPFITFYSFKGGVGRSMALFNVAGIMAGRGFRVLVIDFDLEAPGISYLLRNQAPHGPARPGLVDLLEGAVSDGDSADLFKCTPGEVVDAYTHPYALPQDLIRHPDGELRVLPAGRLDERYQRRLDELDLSGLYREGHGQPLMAEFKKIIGESGRFDLVLVDSRTGFSDESGICTRDLADHIVVVTGLNNQNIEGTAAFLRALHEATGGKRDLLFVLSPVPMGEDELMELREKAAQDAFAAAWQRPVDLNARIYYHPRLALTEEPHVFRSSRGPLYEAYAALERRMSASVGLGEIQLRKEIRAAIGSQQYGRALERSRFLVKVDDGTSFHQILRRSMMDWKDGPELNSFLEFLVEHLPAHTSLHRIARNLHDGSHPFAGRVYERVLQQTPNDADLRGDFAEFLVSVVKDFDAAEAHYRQAIETDPRNIDNLGNFAIFLQTIRKDRAEAETYYRRALDVDPDDGNLLGNLAQLLLARGHDEEGLDALQQAFTAHSSDGEEGEEGDALMCELHFYAYAHGGDRWPDALGALKQLLTRGARSPGWDLQSNVQRARDSGHPEPEFVAALADVVADAAPLATLDGFAAWQQAG